MGRVKTKLVKRTAVKLLRNNKDKFTDDFSKNNPVVNDLLHNPNKKLRNIVSGYITRLVRQNKDLKGPQKK